MEFKDEKIVAFLNQVEKRQEPRDIHTDPIRIGQHYYEFDPQSFFDDKLKVYLPRSFADMSEEQRKLKYPFEQRPQIIKSDETGGINFTLSRLDQELEDGWVKELADGMKAMIRKANPSHVFFSEGIEEAGGKPIAYFDFKGAALDGFIYYIMYFFEFDGKTLMGTFCCEYKDYDDWRDVVFQVIRSIRVVNEDEGDEPQ